MSRDRVSHPLIVVDLTLYTLKIVISLTGVPNIRVPHGGDPAVSLTCVELSTIQQTLNKVSILSKTFGFYKALKQLIVSTDFIV